MQVTRLPRIRGYRVFHDFAWKADLPPFARFNVIYGWNGSGKTALSSLFEHLERSANVTDGEIEFEFDGNRKVSARELTGERLPPARVFNRDFVEATVRAFESNLTPIYYLGRESVRKREEIERLHSEFDAATRELQKRREELALAENELDTFTRNRARVIKEALATARPGRYSNYDKRHFEHSATAMTPQAKAAATLTEAQRGQLRSRKSAVPKEEVPAILVDLPKFSELEAAVDGLLSKTVSSQLISALVDDPEVGSWVQRGLELHSGRRHTERCRFCDGPLSLGRQADLEAHFNDQVTAFQDELAQEVSKLNQWQQMFDAVRPPDSSRLYDDLAEEYELAKTTLEELSQHVVRYVGSRQAFLRQKRDAPFSTPRLPHLAEPIPDEAAFETTLDALNAIVAKHSARTARFEEEVQDACSALEQSLVAEALDEHQSKRSDVGNATAAVEAVADTPAQLQQQISELEQGLVEHMKPAAELNEEMTAYLGHSELQLKVSDDGYAITRNGQPALHLSEGEKTAIAFLYFLKSLQDKSFDLRHGVVVIDDPVSSLDDNSLFSAFGYMKERVKDAGQLLILTHNFAFFRQVKNWYHHLEGQRKRDPLQRPARFFMVKTYISGGRRTASLEPLDKLLEQYESEYHYLFATVHRHAKRSPEEETLEVYYGLPNVTRRLLEGFLAFRCPDLRGDLPQKMERLDFDAERKVRILRLLNTYSHAEALVTGSHDPTALSETRPVLADVLELIQQADPDHFEAMVRLCTEVEDGD